MHPEIISLKVFILVAHKELFNSDGLYYFVFNHIGTALLLLKEAQRSHFKIIMKQGMIRNINMTFY
jgi:hypothetical protein